jgi:GT2 family glycosyltransferase
MMAIVQPQPTAPPAIPAQAAVASLAAPLGIVLVNWNRWADTIECLESVLRSTIPVRIVIVDNGSTDGSLDKIAAWANGEQPVVPVSEAMARFSQPECPKPIPFVRLSAEEMQRPDAVAKTVLTLVDAGANLGFAGGNNAGLRLLLAVPGIKWFWLLNNDTVIEPNAAEALVRRMVTTHNVGMCGTVVRYYHKPDTIQALNGHRFNVWSGQSQGIGAKQPIDTPFDPKRVVAQTDFVLGASLAVSRRFLETIGPMEDRYFLYYEEIDWAARNDRRFAIGFAHGAIIYHKEGGTIGSSGQPGARSLGSEYWLTRSRLAFIRRNRPILLPWHWLVTLSLIARRLLQRQFRKATAITRALFGMGPAS